jgi:hypothetical protein
MLYSTRNASKELGAAMQVHFSTDDLPPAKREEFWLIPTLAQKGKSNDRSIRDHYTKNHTRRLAD